jgi:hypothetical protein
LFQSIPQNSPVFSVISKETIMKRSHKFAISIAAALGLGVGAAAVIAQPGPMGGGNGPHGKGGMQHGKMGGMEHGAMGQGAAGTGAGHSLMTPEERMALHEKMHNAKTPEERQKHAHSTHEQMEKRAKEKGITLPQHGGPGQSH